MGEGCEDAFNNKYLKEIFMIQYNKLNKEMEYINHSKNAAISKNHINFLVEKGIVVNKSKFMKTTLLLCTIGLLMFSCMPLSYYQIYKVQPINNISNFDNSLIYEDTNCKVMYNFWEEYGNAGFLLYNKSDKNIYIDMKECFFIRNGIAYDYYQNREFISQNSTSQSSMYTHWATNTYNTVNAKADLISIYQGYGQTNSHLMGKETNRGYSSSSSKFSTSSRTASFGISIKEQEVVCIPPKSAKIISEYNINGLLYRDCNLFLFPSAKNIRTSNFSEETSPIVFENRISYTIEGTDAIIRMEHKFYISEISNYSYSDITEKVKEKKCEEDDSLPTYEVKFKDASPYKFYIEYSRND